jgi:hypothetical protein
LLTQKGNINETDDVFDLDPINSRRDEMQLFHSMNSNYNREKVSLSRIQNLQSTISQFLNDMNSKQSKLLNIPIFSFRKIFE